MTNNGDRQKCSFQLFRYAPDRLRGEFINIGALLRNTESPSHIEVRFTHDWTRIRCLDSTVDTAQLEAMESELRRELSQNPDSELMRILDESLSLSIQITDRKGYLAESLPAGIDELMRLYVDSPKRERTERFGGRAAIQAKMRMQFERAGVWDLMRKRIAVSQYTRPGDPLRIDAGYRPNGMIRMFHAVSLEPGVEMAKVLAFSAAGLRAGVERLEKAALELTAVIEPAAQLGATDDAPDHLEMYRFGVETMEERQIRVLTTADLERAAETARRELRV